MDTRDEIIERVTEKEPSCSRHGHEWGDWSRNYARGGYTRHCKKCGKYQRRFTDPDEVPYHGERWC